MNIELRRTQKKALYTEGTLTINGQYICDTSEHRLTALPAGTYRIVRRYCKQYARNMPLVIASNRQKPTSKSQRLKARCESCKKMEFVCNNSRMPLVCPMLKPGNGVHNRTDGSILVGTRLIPGCLTHPCRAFGPLYQRIRKNLERGNEVLLTIKC